jgi:hypothetical protein
VHAAAVAASQPVASASSLPTTTQVRPHRLPSHPLPHAQATSPRPVLLPVLPHHRERHVPHRDERHVPHRDRHDHELRRERRAAPLLRLLSVPVLELVPEPRVMRLVLPPPELPLPPLQQVRRASRLRPLYLQLLPVREAQARGSQATR